MTKKCVFDKNFVAQIMVVMNTKEATAYFWSGSGSATQIFSNEWEWECHSKNKGVLNPLTKTRLEPLMIEALSILNILSSTTIQWFLLRYIALS